MKLKTIVFLLIFQNGLFSVFAQQKITFMVDKIELAKDTLKTLSYEQGLEYIFGRKIEAFPIQKKSLRLIPMAFSGGNAFIEILHTAYYEHRPLTLSPDMIWLLICQGFATHINENSKKFQSRLFKHKKKKKIDIFIEEFRKGKNNDWSVVFNQFSDSVQLDTKENIYDLMIANFSTSTEVEKIVYQIVLMETVKKYLELEIYSGCGIHSINIEGKTEDWKLLKEKAFSLRTYDLAIWIDGLLPILDEFILASENKPNIAFWSNIYKHTQPPYGSESISGWIIKFFPYLEYSEDVNGEFKGFYVPNSYLNRDDYYLSTISRGELPRSIVNYAFTWNDLFLDKKYAMVANAGFVGCTQDLESKALRPEISWVIRDTQAPKTKIRYAKNIGKPKNIAPNNFWLQENVTPDLKPMFMPDSCKTYKESQIKLKNYLEKQVAQIKQMNEGNHAQELKGIVKIHFLIAFDGSLANITVTQKNNNLVAQKAIEIIKNMPTWKPAMINIRYKESDNSKRWYKVNHKQYLNIDFGK